MGKTAWIAWDSEYPDEGCEAVFVDGDENDAVVEACRIFGHGILELAQLDMSPRDVVDVVRVGAWDQHAERGWVTSEDLAAVAFEVLTAKAMGAPRG
jgi:hypothetical protein